MEDCLGNAVEVVSVGDAAMTEGHEAMVQASREAMLNASRHGGGAVSVYLEVTDGQAEIFIKDRGPGFELADVPEDRLGVRESIIGRMNRHGGSAAILSGPDGTEVRLRLPAASTDNGAKERSGTIRTGRRMNAAEAGAAGRDPRGDRGRPRHLPVRAQSRPRRQHPRGGGGRPPWSRPSPSSPSSGPTSCCWTCTFPAAAAAAGGRCIAGSAALLGATRFLALSVSDAAEDVVSVIRAGARGYVTKTISGAEITDAVRRVAGGDAVFSPRLAGSFWTLSVPRRRTSPTTNWTSSRPANLRSCA